MNTHPIFYGLTEKGELKVENKSKFQDYLLSLSKPDKPTKIEIIVKRYRKKRSNKQNRYYWLCLNFIGNEIGEDPDELHDTFKAMFLTDRTGKIPIVRSTTKLNTMQFMEYMDKITRKMAETGITLPSPEDMYQDDYNY
jgi:hypothetical protein